jgi:hypothetical protein
MNIGPVEVAPTFNNAFVLNATRDALTAGARATIGAWRGPGTLVVVASMSGAGTRVIAPGGGVAIPRRYGCDT